MPPKPTEATFGLSPSHGGLTQPIEAHEWFLRMMHEHEEFEVETDWAGEWPVPFVSVIGAKRGGPPPGSYFR